ncbi:MAG: hypothetical protein JWM80_4917 [Cyanobacteria bacterium RYN_339]|nr:hypothetical protein [Cyanobacteria bacterium RYN_339]
MTYALTDKTGTVHAIDNVTMASRSTVVRPGDVVVSFVCGSELPNGEYDVKPSLPHESLKVIMRLRITNKTNIGSGMWGYQTLGVR